jgi:predicted MPP superfamily phosphohydrolase
MENTLRVFLENIAILLFCLVMVALMVIIIMKKQASNVKITRTRFGEGDNLVNFIHISDLHIPMHQVSFKKICGIIHDERPHFVVITGDLCLKGHLGKLETFLYMLSNSARCPIYITLGNHDNILFNDEPLAKSAYINALENISPYIRVLENDYCIYETYERKFVIAGLCDHRDDKSYEVPGEGKDKEEYIGEFLDLWNKKAKKENATLIVASHNPDVMIYINGRKADLFLFGHTHGGQIWLPFRLEFKLLRGDKLPHQGYVYGRYEYNGNNMYITSGVGCTLLPLRFRSRPEICVHSI